jgi:hypothetical protein
VKVEELWRSYSKRERRRWKMELLTRGVAAGADLEGTDAAEGATGSGGRNGEFERRPRPYYAPTDVGMRPAQDGDDWDVPESEVNRLAMLFPEAIKIRH